MRVWWCITGAQTLLCLGWLGCHNVSVRGGHVLQVPLLRAVSAGWGAQDFHLAPGRFVKKSFHTCLLASVHLGWGAQNFQKVLGAYLFSDLCLLGRALPCSPTENSEAILSSRMRF